MVRISGVQRSDRGTRNIGVRETTEDLGLGSSDPFGNSLSVGAQNVPAGQVVAADGTFKIPGLRNVELTAPYFHTGGEATLMDVVNFYARGGNQGGASNPITTRSGVVIARARSAELQRAQRVLRFRRRRRPTSSSSSRRSPTSGSATRRRRSTIRRSSCRTAIRGTRTPSSSSTDGRWTRSWRSRPPAGTAAPSCPAFSRMIEARGGGELPGDAGTLPEPVPSHQYQASRCR